MKKLIPMLIAVVVIAGGASFYGGMVYGKSQAIKGQAAQRGGGTDRQFANGGQFRGANGTRPGGQAGAAGFTGGRNGGGLVNGEILSIDANTMTVKMRDGSTKIVLLAGSTEISRFVAGAASDLAVGETVMVMGQANPDGSVIAQTIQQRPAMPVDRQQAPSGEQPVAPSAPRD